MASSVSYVSLNLKVKDQTNQVEFVLTSSTLFTANMFGWTSLISNLVATHPMLLFWFLHALGSLYDFLFIIYCDILFCRIGFFICSVLWDQYEAEMCFRRSVNFFLFVMFVMVAMVMASCYLNWR